MKRSPILGILFLASSFGVAIQSARLGKMQEAATATSQPAPVFARAYIQYREAMRSESPEPSLRAWLTQYDPEATPLLQTLIDYDTEIDPWADDLTRSWDRVRWMRRRMTWRLDRMAGEEMQRGRGAKESAK